jgi:capsular exopolysaccharide synthesis family protein
MYVNSNDVSSTADLNELNYAQKIVSTYINFLQTKKFYQMVADECGLNYTPKQLKKMTEIQAVNNTEIFELSVTAEEQQDSYQIAKTMQNVVPRLIKSIKHNSEISVVDPAVYPTSPVDSQTLLNTIVGAIIGFIGAAIFVLLWEIVDVNVKNQEDLKKRYSIPLLGAIPDFRLNHKNLGRLLHSLPLIKKYVKFHVQRGSIDKGANFFVNEAYNALRTNLRFTLRKDTCKKLIISSPSPQEGKSTTSANLAITLAHSGAKVMLMDCDLRKGTLHNLFQLKSSPGISDILSGMFLEKDVIQTTDYENLEVLSMGALPPNPNELLNSIQMEDLIKKLEKNYDYIIIDSSPVNIVSDVLGLVKMADGVVLVVREGITSHNSIENVISKYKLSQANILGFVLNGVYMKQSKKLKSKYY